MVVRKVKLIKEQCRSEIKVSAEVRIALRNNIFLLALTHALLRDGIRHKSLGFSGIKFIEGCLWETGNCES